MPIFRVLSLGNETPNLVFETQKRLVFLGLSAPYNKRASRALIFFVIFVGNFTNLFFFSVFFKIPKKMRAYYTCLANCTVR